MKEKRKQLSAFALTALVLMVLMMFFNITFFRKRTVKVHARHLYVCRFTE